jgi:hypothetical protein
MPSRKAVWVKTEKKWRLAMYTGTLIEDLIATVEQANEQAYTQLNSRDEKLAYCYTPAPHKLSQREPNLLGVA